MDSFQSYKSLAEQKLKVADHLLSTTYSIVKEPKLLVSVIENLYSALEYSISAVLEYEKGLETINNTGTTFESKVEIFRRKVMPRREIRSDLLDFVSELKATIDKHKRSSVEFAKKEKFVISDNDYNLKTLSLDDVKASLTKTKKFMNELFSLARLEQL